MIAWVKQLQSREQKLVFSGLSIVLLLAVYEFVWLPVDQHVEVLQVRVSAQQKQLNKLRDIVSQYRSLIPVEPVERSGNESMLSLVDRTSKSNHVKQSIKSFTPAGDKKVRVQLANVEFDQLVRWLSALSGQGLQVEQIDITQEQEEGVVSAAMLLVSDS